MLEILTLPTPSLRKRSTEVDRAVLSDSEIQTFLDKMIQSMYSDDGIGLAAPQVARNIRICVIGKAADPSLQEDLVLVNPVWKPRSKKKNVDVEGCLSVPNVFGKVKRYSNIMVEAYDRNGQPLSFAANHFFARVIQHEVDHLNGILFIDKAHDIYDVPPADESPHLV